MPDGHATPRRYSSYSTWSLSPVQTFAMGLAAVVAIYLNIVPAYAILPNPMDQVRQLSSHPVLQYGWPLTVASVEAIPDSYSAVAAASYRRLSLLAIATDLAIVSTLTATAIIGFGRWIRSNEGRFHVYLSDLLMVVCFSAVPLAMIVSEYRRHRSDERAWAAIQEEDWSNALGYKSPQPKRVVSPGDYLLLRRIFPERWFRPLDRIVGAQLSSGCFPYVAQLDRLTMLAALDFAPSDFEHLKSCQRLHTPWIMRALRRNGSAM
jgi:hypothetical protein